MLKPRRVPNLLLRLRMFRMRLELSRTLNLREARQPARVKMALVSSLVNSLSMPRKLRRRRRKLFKTLLIPRKISTKRLTMQLKPAKTMMPLKRLQNLKLPLMSSPNLSRTRPTRTTMRCTPCLLVKWLKTKSCRLTQA